MSRLPFEVFMALRYLRPKRTFVSVITLISVLGVMLGVAVMIIVIGVMAGFDRELRAKVLGFTSHLTVADAQGLMADFPSVMARVRANPHVRGVAPYVISQVLIETQPAFGSPRTAAKIVRGIDLDYESEVSQLTSNIVAGELNLAGSSILIGSSCADELQLHLEDRIAVYSTRHLEEFRRSIRDEVQSAVLPEDFTVRGVFNLGYYEYDSSFLITSLENAQDLLDLDDRVHGLMVMVDDPMQAHAIRQELLASLGADYLVGSWMDNSTLLDAVVVEKKVMFIVLFFITIVAAFGIMNSLITFVVNKTREIGLIKTLGASHSQVFGLFLTQSLIVGVAGVVIGCAVGLTGLAYRNEFLEFMRDWTRLELFPAEVYGFTQLPALTQARDVLLICGSALAACLFAAILPVRIAVRLKPIDALRHE